MAVVFALAGGVVGFWLAAVSLVFFDAGVLTALAIWSGTGIGCLLLGVTLMLRREAPPQTKPMTPDARVA